MTHDLISFKDKFDSLVKLKQWMSDKKTIDTIDMLMAKSYNGSQLGLLTEHQAHQVEQLWEIYFGEKAQEKLECSKQS